MADNYDPLDIRSEMAASRGVPPTEATPPSTPIEAPISEDLSQMIAAAPEAVPLETIDPVEPGNEIIVENPPDFAALNREFPPPPPLRRSKRQAGYDPDFVAAKKPRVSSFTSNVLDPDFSSGDDSEDEDFELVARPRPNVASHPSTSTPAAQPEDVPDQPSEKAFSSEDEQPLADILNSLKEARIQKESAQESDSEPDKEMAQKFAENRPNSSSSPSSTSNFEDENAFNTESSESNSDSAAEEVEGAADVVEGVDNTADNTIDSDYDLSVVFSNAFYSEDAVGRWYLYAHREFIEERNIDEEAYSRQNLISFLSHHGLLATVTCVLPYAKRPVREFYSNLTAAIGDVNSARFGRVFVRDAIYQFSAEFVNDYYRTPTADENAPAADIDEVTTVLTGGVITKFPVRPHRLDAANLASFYSVLHKTAIWNWTPSSNTTVVTRPQALLLFDIGMGRPFDFGQHVFQTIMLFAEGELKSTRLPFPSLIFGILEAQGFIAEDDEKLFSVGESLKIAPAYFKGNRKLDLPWTDSGVAPDVCNIASSSTTTPHDFVMLSPSRLQAQIDFGLKQIQNAKELIAHYEAQIAEYRLLLEVGIHSGHKGGVQNAGDADADAAAGGDEALDDAEDDGGNDEEVEGR